MGDRSIERAQIYDKQIMGALLNSGIFRKPEIIQQYILGFKIILDTFRNSITDQNWRDFRIPIKIFEKVILLLEKFPQEKPIAQTRARRNSI